MPKFSLGAIIPAAGLLVALSAPANANLAINIDEDGNGVLHSVSGASTLGYDAAFADPTAGGHPTLSYRLDDLAPTVTAEGDVVLIEPQGGPGGGTNSDLIRFVTTSIGGKPTTRIFFYSDTSDTDLHSDLADTGTPTSGIGQWPGAATEQQPLEIGREGQNGVIYTPTNASMPGFITGQSVTYFITSDIPEPGTFALLGAGLAGLRLARRRVRHPKA